MNNYMSLHLHTTKSIGDAIITIDDLIKKYKELKINALSITNHGSMADVFEVYSKCKKENIKPIIGCEVYVVNPENDKEYNHLVLIAKNKKGYKNLLKIHNFAHLKGFYRKPRVTDEILKAYGDNIICLSACVGGLIPKYIEKAENVETEEEAQLYTNKIINTINNYKQYFDEFYLEIQPGNFEKQKIVNKYLIEYFAPVTNTPLIITNDVHYLDKEDYKIHNIHVCSNKKSNDLSELVYPDKCYYVMTNEEIKKAININDDLFNSCLNNINHIISEIDDYDIIPKKIYMPKYKKLPKGYTEDSYLSKLCIDKLNSMKNVLKDPSIYFSRLLTELDTIKTLNFSGYFLIVKDFLDKGRSERLELGPGRGSVCGSLIAYLLGITKVDPIRFDLLFERFLSIFRKSPPDIDSDIESEGRDKLFEYIINEYGEECCALVSTFTMRKSKSAIKDTGRVFNIEKEIYEYVASLIPQVYYEDDEDGNTEKKTDLSIEESLEIVPELKKYQEEYPEWFEAAIKLSNIPRATSVHAAGTLISPVPLGEYIPLIRSNHDMINATALNLKDAEEAGFIKFDFLGLHTLTMIRKVKESIGVNDLYDFIGDDFNDPLIWNLISSKYTAGLFQISSPTYKQRMRRLGCRTIEDLAACLALVRGPCIASKADEIYMNIIAGKEEIEKIHPIYDKVTEKTLGILLYQEQFMQILVNMGFSTEESYIAMKAASKKDTEKLKKYEEEFNSLAKKKNMDSLVAKRIFKILVDTGLYSFNKSHAIAYAILCYITAFLKVYYPKEFFAAALSVAYKSSSNDRERVIKDLVNDCRRVGISFKNVDINKSQWDFTVEDDGLRIGFCALKSFGYKAYLQVEKNRPIKDIPTLMDSVVRTDCGKKAIVPAIFVGAFNEMYNSEKDAYFAFCDYDKEKEPSREVVVQGTSTRLSIDSFREEFEAAFLVCPLVSDPINDFEAIGVDNFYNGKKFKIKGLYDKIKRHTTKTKNEKMAFFDIRTGDGLLECTIFPREFAQYSKLVKKSLVCNFELTKKDDKYIVRAIELAS